MIFDRCQQRVLPWGHIGATWRIRLNLCILQPTGVHNRNGKWIGSAVFAELTAQSAYTLQWAPLFTRSALSHGDLLCLHRWPQSVPIWFVCFALKIVPSHVGIWTPCNSLGPHESGTQMATWSFQPFLQGSLVWQTDRSCWSRALAYTNWP